MRGIAVEDVGDGFALVGRQGDDVDQCFDAGVADCADNAAGVRVAGQDDGSFGSIDGSLDGVHVVVERGERDGGGDDVDPGLLQTGDDASPARPVGPRSVDENDSGFSRDAWTSAILPNWDAQPRNLGHFSPPDVFRSRGRRDKMG